MSLFPYYLISKELLGCKEFHGFISNYLPKLAYSQWVSTSTPDPKLPDLIPTDVQDWTLRTNLKAFKLSELLLINIK